MSKSSRTIYAFVLSFSLILTTVTAQQKPPEEKIDVIRISTELVQTHITVLDKKGNSVTGLRPDQFQVQVDGKAQNISFFEEVTAGGLLDRPLVVPPAGTGNDSLITTLQFPKLPTGLIQVRIAARDSKSGRIGTAVQWVELPNLSQNKFSVSSLFLSEGVASSQGTVPKWIIKPDRRFARTGKLKFQVFVYNADQSAGAPVVHLQLELRREGQVMVQTPPGPIDMKGVADLGRIPVVGDFPLADFPPGRYEMKLIFTDQKTKSSASRETEFTIL